MPEANILTQRALVVECLSRSIGELSWLEPLKMHSEHRLPQSWAAIGFDTNGLKQLRRFDLMKRSSIFTYLQSKSVPIILPVQAVQEYWNNHGIFTKDVQLESDTRKLLRQFEKASGGQVASARYDAIATLLNQLAEEAADSQNPHLLKESIDLWESLLANSTLAHMPRHEILSIGEMHFASGIAPGFADGSKGANRLGDFFVWADFLMGLQMIGLGPNDSSNSLVVFVTDDEKRDWITSGVPHPTLLGEIYHLTGRPLSILTMNELCRIVQP